MLHKKEENKKHSAVWKKLLTLAMLVSPIKESEAAKLAENDPMQPKTELKENNISPTFMSAPDDQTNQQALAEAKDKWDKLAVGHYKGLEIDMRTLAPEDVAHVFESGMDPCITNGRLPISKASYLGLCQMSLSTVVPAFTKEHKDKYPELYNVMTKNGVRSNAFLKKWKEYSYGSTADEFKADQFKTMWSLAYEKTFDNLAATGLFPKITLDNYAKPENFIYSAAVISCVNQSPKRTPEIFKQAYNQVKNKKDLAAIALQTYTIKSVKWPKCASRYKEEAKMLRQKQQELKFAELYNNLFNVRYNTLTAQIEPIPNVKQLDLSSVNAAEIQHARAELSRKNNNGETAAVKKKLNRQRHLYRKSVLAASHNRNTGKNENLLAIRAKHSKKQYS